MDPGKSFFISFIYGERDEERFPWVFFSSYKIKKDFPGFTLPLIRCFRPQYLTSLALPLIVGIGNRSKWITRKPNWKVTQTLENERYIYP